MYPTVEVWNYKLPGDSWTGFQFDFQSERLGFLPTAFGFARPYSATADADLTIDVYGRGGMLLDSTTSTFSTSSDLPFIGVTALSGISRVVITSHTLTSGSERRSANLSIDHFQYGLIVPEPSTVFLTLFAAAGACSHYTGIKRKGLPR